jgi:hypothetical protein
MEHCKYLVRITGQFILQHRQCNAWPAFQVTNWNNLYRNLNLAPASNWRNTSVLPRNNCHSITSPQHGCSKQNRDIYHLLCTCVCVCGLFTLLVAQTVQQRMIRLMNNKLKRMCEEAVVTYFNVLPIYFSERPEKTYKRSSVVTFGQGSAPGTTAVRSICANHSTARARDSTAVKFDARLHFSPIFSHPKCYKPD